MACIWDKIRASESDRYVGAHKHLEAVLFSRDCGGGAQRRPDKQVGSIRGISAGIELDDAMTRAVSAIVNGTRHFELTDIGHAVRRILKTLRTDHDFTPVDTQRKVTSIKDRVSPILDLIGVTSKGVPVIVEIKCGSTAGSGRLTSGMRFFQAPMQRVRDTWRNRSFAQLSVQRAAVLCTSERAGIKLKRIICLLACVAPDGNVRIMKLARSFY